MTTPENRDDVRPALERAEAALARHLEEACEDHDRENIGDESTDELLRLEEELIAAARAADEAVRLRRRLAKGRGEGEGRHPTASQPAPGPGAEAAGEEPAAEASPTRVREFRTASGSEWRVWEVRPAAGGRPRKLELYPADYVEGWLTFELIEGEGRKRLPKFATDWSNAADTELERLLQKAVDVPKRKKDRE